MGNSQKPTRSQLEIVTAYSIDFFMKYSIPSNACGRLSNPLGSALLAALQPRCFPLFPPSSRNHGCRRADEAASRPVREGDEGTADDEDDRCLEFRNTQLSPQILRILQAIVLGHCKVSAMTPQPLPAFPRQVYISNSIFGALMAIQCAWGPVQPGNQSLVAVDERRSSITLILVLGAANRNALTIIVVIEHMLSNLYRGPYTNLYMNQMTDYVHSC